MTGYCYYCTAGDHSDCHSESCTCCGERNREHNRQVEELVILMQEDLARRGRKPPQSAITSAQGYCHDCAQGMLGPVHEGFELYILDDRPSHWFCRYCGSNHVTIRDAAGSILFEQGDLYAVVPQGQA